MFWFFGCLWEETTFSLFSLLPRSLYAYHITWKLAVRLKKKIRKDVFWGYGFKKLQQMCKKTSRESNPTASEEQLFTLASFHTAQVQLRLTGLYRCKRATGTNSFCGEKPSTSHLPMCLNTSAARQRKNLCPVPGHSSAEWALHRLALIPPYSWDAKFQTQRLQKKHCQMYNCFN